MRILGMLLWCAACAAHASESVHEYRLENGLKLVVKTDHRAPVVVSQVWYKVGGSYEHAGSTGLSHLLEHMMFKGTERHPPGEFSRLIAAQGGRENAFTGDDYTAYYQQLAVDRLEVSFALESDRMQGLVVKPDEFAKEQPVVMEERRLRTEDDPQSLTYEAFRAAAFQVSPYRQPVIGWMDDIKHLTPDDLKNWYQTWYAPNNATLVVVGDVDPHAVLALAQKYYGPLKARPIPALKPRNEPPQRGERRITVKLPAELPYVLLGYKVPVLTSPAIKPWEPYALQVLASALGDGESARLARHVVRGSELAANASAGYNPYDRLDSLLLMDATPAQGRDAAAVEHALREEVRKLREQPIDTAELERVKARVLADAVYQQVSMFYQAMQIGTLETVGLSWREHEAYVPRIQAVTAEQVQEVARRYLTDEHLSVAVLQPLPPDPNKPRPLLQGGDSGHVH